MYLGIVILVCFVFLKVKYLMPLHFRDTKASGSGVANDMSVTCPVHAKNELFFFQTCSYTQVAVQFLVSLQNSKKKKLELECIP